jgi:hypothetical protein
MPMGPGPMPVSMESLNLDMDPPLSPPSIYAVNPPAGTKWVALAPLNVFPKANLQLPLAGTMAKHGLFKQTGEFRLYRFPAGHARAGDWIKFVNSGLNCFIPIEESSLSPDGSPIVSQKCTTLESLHLGTNDFK